MGWREAADEIPLDPEPGRRDPRAAQRWLSYARPPVRWAFRPRLEGIEQLPASGPFMIVANHSGMGLAEIMALIVCMLEKLGPERRIAGMVHPLSLRGWPAGGWMRRMGAIPSTYRAARDALAKGVPVLVFPGGDHEAGRPVWQARRVDFGGRRGFLEIARDAGVPIVPLGIRGSHYTAPILWRSEWLLPRLLVVPHLMGVKRVPLTLLGVAGAVLLGWLGPIGSWWLTGALVWLWLWAPLNQLPWIPWAIRMRIGAPIANQELFGDASPDAPLGEAYERVQAAVQRLVTSD